MANKREIRAIRGLLSRYKISLNDLRAIVKDGKGVSKRNDEILKRYNVIRGPAGVIVRGMQDLNEQSKQRARSEGRNTGILSRAIHAESTKQKTKKRKPTALKNKEVITPKDVQTFKKFYNLNEPDFQRILSGNPQNDFENKVYADAQKIFIPEKMKKLPETVDKKNPAVQSYTKARDTTSGSEYTQEQQDANEKLARTLQGQQDPTITTIGGDDQEQSRGAIGRNLPAFIEAFQQSGQQQRPRFGAPTSSPLLQAYDAFVNRIRPEEGQLSKLARKYQPVTNLAGRLGGRAGGAALGGLFGMPGLGALAGGFLGDEGATQLTDYLTQERPEFSRLANLLRGGEAGYFTRGKRGLADIIEGTQGTDSKLKQLLRGFGGSIQEDIGALGKVGRGILGENLSNLAARLGRGALGFRSNQQPLTRSQRFRRGMAAPVRGLGDLLASPNAARNLRLALGSAQGLYDIGKATGINDWLSRKLGFAPQYSHTGFETGEQLANPVIAGIVQRSLPFLQEQTSRILGRNVTPEEVMGGLDAQLRDALTPQVMQRNIQRSNEDIARRQIQQQVNVEEANRQARQAQQLLRQQEQMQRFGHQATLGEQRGLEAELQADLAARQGNIAAQQAVMRQQITPQPPLRRVVQQPTQLWNVAEEIARRVEPVAGQMIAEGRR